MGSEPRFSGRQLVLAILGTAVAVALVALVVVALVTDDDDDRDEAASPTGADTASEPTPTSGTEPPSSGTSRPPSSGTGAGRPPTSGTGTSRPPTSGTSEPPTTGTTQPVEEPVVLLESDGFANLELGEDGEVVVARLTSLFGEPDEDSGFIGGFDSPFGVCPDPVRGVRWGSLRVLLTESETSFAPAGPAHFFSYVDAGFLGGEPSGARTPEGIGVGSIVAELRSAYGDQVEVTDDEIFGPAFFISESTTEPDGLGRFGSLTGLGDDATVESIGVGACGE